MDDDEGAVPKHQRQHDDIDHLNLSFPKEPGSRPGSSFPLFLNRTAGIDFLIFIGIRPEQQEQHHGEQDERDDRPYAERAASEHRAKLIDDQADDIGEQILEDDKVDMVVIGRGQLVDPDFCNKAEAGNTEEIDYCVGCNQGCYDGFESKDSPCITCLRNPAVGREKECELIPAEKPETVLIAGGGIGGLEAAIILKKRGHNPILVRQQTH